MCGRYYIEIEEPEMRDILHAVERNLGNTAQHAAMKMGEIFPTNIVPVQAADLGYTLMKWGFSRYDGKGQVINARSETASEKPMFRTSLLESRCIVPASYYFEWEKVGTKKIKYSFRMPDAGLLYLAGLYRVEQNSEVPVFTILTRDAAPQLMQIHHRMPVIIPKSSANAWLTEGSAAMGKAVENISFELAQ
ncbi:SOS response-associated peptidase [Christensenellaceae bacterium OttesenSCG-928-M15]|nr:SOS response-associated peptidase [Christensenellaceae bacterium OttesenSCG-928-M15]